MKISGKRNYMLSLESVVMTDIVLNMFIFFFISFSLLYTFEPFRAQKLEIKLPKASNTTPIGEEEQLSVTLTNEGALYLGKELITVKDLQNRISLRYKNNPRLSVVLRADRLVRFKQVVNILDILSGLGITRLNIAAVQE
ncbi:MAG: biopolymer transporter ExbD [Candidatus Omnitrophica bacterium]|nr:biopolymer transporter ExbD [Candidatus Omnitrophota bacterium]MDD5660771.1 biopolymer transporter ExbD [Candidatus Omnitrophota bacterium]